MSVLFFRYAVLGVLLLSLGQAVSSCQPVRGEPTPAGEQSDLIAGEVQPIAVKVQAAERRDFPLRIMANGVLRATRQAQIASLRSGRLVELPIREGEQVAAGQLLARLDDAGLQLQLEQNRLILDEAAVNKKDLLIANGGDAESDSSVSARKLELILTLSGYNKARHGMKQTQYELEQTRITAPFAGVIADIQTKTFQSISPGQQICTLIDPHSFEATFSVLEAEALPLKPGQPVIVSPLAGPEQTLRARIRTINPQVDAQGLVRVKALLQTSQMTGLFEGMNLRIVIERSRPNQLVVPRSALVLRSGREVIFTYDKDAGEARWNYVRSGEQNDTHVTIREGLEEGALVICQGHLNLDHGTNVVLQ